jgi:nitrite reductase/ring-hydroxylating ferredoxin subunit
MHTDELGDPDARSFSVGDGDWPFGGFIVRKNGQIYAYANICPHRRHPLDLEPHAFLVDNGNLIRCASHGALFCPETGACLAGPCAGRSLITLPCRSDPDGTIRVNAPATLRDRGLSE